MRRAPSIAVAVCGALLLVLAVLQANAGPDIAPNPLSEALAAESGGDAAKAESLLRQSMQADRGSQPRWTLANFYLRHKDQRAWPLLAEALAIALHGGQDVSGIFETGWQFRPEGTFLLERIVGQNPDALKAYLSFLLRTGRVEALTEPAMLVWDKTLLLQASDALLTAGHAAEAKKVWERAEPSPDNGELLINPQLDPPKLLGFDWRFNSIAEAPIVFDQGVRVSFTGRQPSPLELLIQTVVLKPGKYRLTWESRAPSDAGVFWQATCAATFREAIHSDADNWLKQSKEFDLRAEGTIRLVLAAERLQGSSRFEGTFQLRNPSLRVR